MWQLMFCFYRPSVLHEGFRQIFWWLIESLKFLKKIFILELKKWLEFNKAYVKMTVMYKLYRIIWNFTKVILWFGHV